MKMILDRLRQPSTVAGAIALLASLAGLAVFATTAGAIAAAVADLVGPYEVVRDER